MSDEMPAGRGDGAQLPTDLVAGESARIEIDAARLLSVVEAVAASKLPSAVQARKYVDRLTFAITRLDELKRAAAFEGGVFAPARAEVAASILEGHVAGAAGFINRTMRQVRRAPGRRDLRVEVDEALTLIEDETLAEDQTRAA
jgi:hypothetical protein